MAEPINQYISRGRFVAKLGLGWTRTASMHNIFALPVLSYVAQVQGDSGIREEDSLDTAWLSTLGRATTYVFAFYCGLFSLLLFVVMFQAGRVMYSRLCFSWSVFVGRQLDTQGQMGRCRR
jgi:hypothetical protein